MSQDGEAGDSNHDASFRRYSLRNSPLFAAASSHPRPEPSSSSSLHPHLFLHPPDAMSAATTLSMPFPSHSHALAAHHHAGATPLSSYALLSPHHRHQLGAGSSHTGTAEYSHPDLDDSFAGAMYMTGGAQGAVSYPSGHYDAFSSGGGAAAAAAGSSGQSMYGPQGAQFGMYAPPLPPTGSASVAMGRFAPSSSSSSSSSVAFVPHPSPSSASASPHPHFSSPALANAAHSPSVPDYAGASNPAGLGSGSAGYASQQYAERGRTPSGSSSMMGVGVGLTSVPSQWNSSPSYPASGSGGGASFYSSGATYSPYALHPSSVSSAVGPYAAYRPLPGPYASSSTSSSSAPPPPTHFAYPMSSLHARYAASTAPPAPPPRLFKCSVCPASFSRNHDLKRHARIHLAVKPFACQHCGKGFSRKDALKRHILVKGCGGGQKKRGRKSRDGGDDADADEIDETVTSSSARQAAAKARTLSDQGRTG